MRYDAPNYPEECTPERDFHLELARDLAKRLPWLAQGRALDVMELELADFLDEKRDKYILEDV